MFQKSTINTELRIELYGYTFNKQFIPSKGITKLVKHRTPIMILRSPKHFKVGKHIVQRYTIFFRILFRIKIASVVLYTLVRNFNKVNFFMCIRLLPYTGTYTTIIQKYKVKFKYKILF